MRDYLRIAAEGPAGAAAKTIAQRGPKVGSDCRVVERAARHHHGNAARVFVAFGLLALPSKKFVQRHQLFGNIRYNGSLLRWNSVVQTDRLRQASERAGDGRDPLDYSRPRGTETSPCSKAMTVSIAKAASSLTGRSRKSGLCGRPNRSLPRAK